jgi:hypothetical protein
LLFEIRPTRACKTDGLSDGTSGEEIRSNLSRFGPASDLLALKISGSTFAFFDLVILLSHKSLLSEVVPVV